MKTWISARSAPRWPLRPRRAGNRRGPVPRGSIKRHHPQGSWTGRRRGAVAASGGAGRPRDPMVPKARSAFTEATAPMATRTAEETARRETLEEIGLDLRDRGGTAWKPALSEVRAIGAPAADGHHHHAVRVPPALAAPTTLSPEVTSLLPRSARCSTPPPVDHGIRPRLDDAPAPEPRRRRSVICEPDLPDVHEPGRAVEGGRRRRARPRREGPRSPSPDPTPAAAPRIRSRPEDVRRAWVHGVGRHRGHRAELGFGRGLMSRSIRPWWSRRSTRRDRPCPWPRSDGHAGEPRDRGRGRVGRSSGCDCRDLVVGSRDGGEGRGPPARPFGRARPSSGCSRSRSSSPRT